MADVTDATFETEVVERSKTVPVVIDLWAEWCGPCKTLGPILEKVIGETEGLVELAKVDVEANPQISQAFQVQSIPAVYGMVNGQIVDGFVGALGEPDVVAFVQRLLDGTAVAAAAEAASADAGDEAAPEGAAEAPAGAAAPSISEPGLAAEEPAPVAPAGPSAAEADAIEAELIDLLTKVKGDDEARERYVSLLDQLGADDPRTNNYRRKLATALF